MKLLVGVDLSESTERVVNKVEEIAKALSAQVWLLYIAEPEPDFVGFDFDPESMRDSRAKEFHVEHSQIQEIADRL
ncbi:MAG: universal stress protein [Gallionellaceae bacterium]